MAGRLCVAYLHAWLDACRPRRPVPSPAMPCRLRPVRLPTADCRLLCGLLRAPHTPAFNHVIAPPPPSEKQRPDAKCFAPSSARTAPDQSHTMCPCDWIPHTYVVYTCMACLVPFLYEPSCTWAAKFQVARLSACIRAMFGYRIHETWLLGDFVWLASCRHLLTLTEPLTYLIHALVALARAWPRRNEGFCRMNRAWLIRKSCTAWDRP
jgi:hypothetical protein